MRTQLFFPAGFHKDKPVWQEAVVDFFIFFPYTSLTQNAALNFDPRRRRCTTQFFKPDLAMGGVVVAQG